MIHFDTDYMAGACPQVLDALVKTNYDLVPGYGHDKYTREAEKLILQACGLKDGRVYFLTGGTQTNAVVLSALLSHSQGVIAADMGHINVHEAGAIEATGHKIFPLPSQFGKIKASDIDDLMRPFYEDDTYEHQTVPAGVYISFPTEMGEIYSLKELEELHKTCHKHHLFLYLDGARLGYGLTASNNDVTLKDITRLTDVFYIGGTKEGAMFGEAIVVKNPDQLSRFFTYIKERGALFAKGRLIGVQFHALMSNDVLLNLCREADRKADHLTAIMSDAGYKIASTSTTNQRFFVMPNRDIDLLREHISFENWGAKGQEETTVRFVTSWYTSDEDLAELERQVIGCRLS